MKLRTIVLSIVLASSSTVFAEELTNEKKTAIKKLLDVTNAGSMGMMMAENVLTPIIKAVLNQYPNNPTKDRIIVVVEEEYDKLLQEELLATGELYELIYPIYHKYLTLKETEELLAFYTTPLGKKLINVMPAMTQESIQVGTAWGSAMEQSMEPILRERIRRRLSEEGIE